MAESEKARPSGVRDSVGEQRSADARRGDAEADFRRGGVSKGDGKIVVSGRFKPGQRVRLFQVAGPWVLRSAAGLEVEAKKVEDDGTVEFTGLDEGRRYFVVGKVDGEPVELRATASPGDGDPVLSQPSIGYDRKRLADGRWLDEVESGEAALEVGEDADQLGLATGEQAPYPSQEVVGEKVQQRSNTPLGAATPIPAGDPVDIAAGGPKGAQKAAGDKFTKGSDS